MFVFTEKRESPKFIRKLENVDVVEKDSATLEVEISGKPKPQVTWWVNKTDGSIDSYCLECS